MKTDSDYVPTRPAGMERTAMLALSLTQMLQAIEAVKNQPVITLAMAIEQLGIMNHREIEVIRRQTPELLRNRSADLVQKLLITVEDLNHALARTAGTVEVDAAKFALPAHGCEALPLRVLRARDLLFLGEANGCLFVASWCPLNDELHAQLCALTGRSVRMVWAGRDAIAQRLDRLGRPPVVVVGLAFPSPLA